MKTMKNIAIALEVISVMSIASCVSTPVELNTVISRHKPGTIEYRVDSMMWAYHPELCPSNNPLNPDNMIKDVQIGEEQTLTNMKLLSVTSTEPVTLTHKREHEDDYFNVVSYLLKDPAGKQYIIMGGVKPIFPGKTYDVIYKPFLSFVRPKYSETVNILIPGMEVCMDEPNDRTIDDHIDGLLMNFKEMEHNEK
jgi:hypothetical protein